MRATRLDIEEIQAHIAAGRVAHKLALTWDDPFRSC